MTNPEKTWRKSSYTAPDNNCVELAVSDAQTVIRDSKDPVGGSFAVSANAWIKFLAHARSHGFKQ